MITFILPGYSPRNKDWASEVAERINVGGEIRPVSWDHWSDPEKRFNPDKKAQDVIDVLLDQDAAIIAKSAGTLVCALVVRQIPQRVKKVILCGIPTVSEARLKVFKEAFAGFPPKNVFCIQNAKDPFASYDKVASFMRKVNGKIKVVKGDRNDHNYPYFDEFGEFLGR